MALERVAVTWQPLPYMKKAVKFLLEHAAAGIFADPGLRKTSITLAALKVLKKQGLMHRTLIIAPLRVCYLVWPLEVQKWKDFNEFKVEVLHGPKKDQALAREADIYLINPEGLEWLFGVTHTRNKRGKVEMKIDMKRVKELGFDTLVVDESSKLKHVNTLRFKILKPLLPRFSRRWILTGSPAPNGLMDLFGVPPGPGERAGAVHQSLPHEVFLPYRLRWIRLAVAEGGRRGDLRTATALGVTAGREGLPGAPRDHTKLYHGGPAARGTARLRRA